MRNGHNSTLRLEQLDFDLFTLRPTPPHPIVPLHTSLCQGTGKFHAKVRRHARGEGSRQKGSRDSRMEEVYDVVIYLFICLFVYLCFKLGVYFEKERNPAEMGMRRMSLIFINSVLKLLKL